MRGWLSFFRFGKHSIKHASALLAITALVSNVLGLFRNVIFYRLVSKDNLDVYFASFRVSDFLFNLLIFAAITTAVIPVLSELLKKQEEKEAQEATNQLLSWSFLFFTFLFIILYLLMPELARLIIPHFEADKTAKWIYLSRIMLIQPILFSISFIIGGFLNARQRFSSYALAPLVYNCSLIVGGIATKYYGINAVTYSVVIGSLFHFLIQYREAALAHFRFRFSLGFSPAFRQMLQLMLLPNLGQGFGQLVLIIYTNLSSGLEHGSISIYSGINNLQTTPTVVIANSLASAFFPTAIALTASNEQEKLDALFEKVVRSALFLLLPTIVLAIVLRAQLIRLYVGIGGYSWELTQIGIATFMWFMIGIIPTSLNILIGRLFYANKDTKTPVFIGIVGGIASIITAYTGIANLHHTVATLAVAETISAFIQFFLLLSIALQRGYIRHPFHGITRYATSYLVGSILMAWLSWASLQAVDIVYHRLHYLGTQTIIGLLIQTIIAGLVGIAVYFGYSTVKSKEELQWVKRRGFIPNS